jgi:hypothetical protein
MQWLGGASPALAAAAQGIALLFSIFAGAPFA